MKHRVSTRASAVLVAFTVAAGLLMSACGDSDDSSTATGTSGDSGTKTIKIGVLAPLQGSVAADGELMKQGAQLAIDELNAAGGVAGYKFALKVGDTQDLKSDAVAAAANDMISDSDVKAVVTGYASLTNFEIDTFAQAKMPYLISASSASTRAIVSKDPSKYPTIWSLAPSYDAFGTGLPKFLEQLVTTKQLDLRKRTAYIITADNPYSKDIATGLKKTLAGLNWKVAGEQTIPFTAINEWGSILEKIRSADPGLIVNLDSQPPNQATFLKQFLQDPTDSIMFMQYGPSVPQFLELTKAQATGVLYNLLVGPIESPKWKPATELVNAFKEAYGGKHPGAYGAELYDSVKVYAEALKKVGDPDKKEEIGKAIGESTFELSGGPTSFDPETHLAVQSDADGIPLQFIQINDGQRILLAPDRYKTGDFKLPPWFRNR